MDLRFTIHPEVEQAVRKRQAVVALESTLIAHGLPWPLNFETALAAEEAIREQGAVPATIAVWKGVPTVGLLHEQIRELAQAPNVLKASRRDLALAAASNAMAATTVSATMFLAQSNGIQVFATGGIGGVHRGAEKTGDVSADLIELSRTRVAVVCAGAKSILDLPRTLEALETLGVPVLGYQTDEFPAFYQRRSGLKVPARVDDPREAALVIRHHWNRVIADGAGILIAQAVAEEVALSLEEWERALQQVEGEASAAAVRGKDVTPFLLRRLADVTEGRSLKANQALIVANARLAAQIAWELCGG
jgi:pseudouridine-5'-phosphate glycosidase